MSLAGSPRRLPSRGGRSSPTTTRGFRRLGVEVDNAFDDDRRACRRQRPRRRPAAEAGLPAGGAGRRSADRAGRSRRWSCPRRQTILPAAARGCRRPRRRQAVAALQYGQCVHVGSTSRAQVWQRWAPTTVAAPRAAGHVLVHLAAAAGAALGERVVAFAGDAQHLIQDGVAGERGGDAGLAHADRAGLLGGFGERALASRRSSWRCGWRR